MGEAEATKKIEEDGAIRYYLNGELHRTEGPAVELCSGNEYWYLHGKLHREGAPAVTYRNGNEYWYLDGRLHRECGPAVELSDGTKIWYYNGKEVFCSTQQEFQRLINLRTLW